MDTKKGHKTKPPNGPKRQPGNGQVFEVTRRIELAPGRLIDVSVVGASQNEINQRFQEINRMIEIGAKEVEKMIDHGSKTTAMAIGRMARVRFVED